MLWLPFLLQFALLQRVGEGYRDQDAVSVLAVEHKSFGHFAETLRRS